MARTRQRRFALAGSASEHEHAAEAATKRLERIVASDEIQQGSCRRRLALILDAAQLRAEAMADLVWMYKVDRQAGKRVRRSFGMADLHRRTQEAAFSRECLKPSALPE